MRIFIAPLILLASALACAGSAPQILKFNAPLSKSGATVSLPAATNSVDGYLSHTDWTTFNNKQSTLTFSGPLVNTGGTVSCTAATGSVPGCLASSDWTTFNSKQPALGFTPLNKAGDTMTGDLSFSGTHSVSTASGGVNSGDLTVTAGNPASGTIGSLILKSASLAGGGSSQVLAQNLVGGGDDVFTAAVGSWRGNSFTPTASANITDIQVHLKIHDGTPAGNLVIKIFADSGGSGPGTLLATSNNFDTSALTSTFTWYTFTFPIPLAVTSGTLTFFEIITDGVTGGRVSMEDSSSNPYSGGTIWYTETGGAPFTQLTAYDLMFIVDGASSSRGKIKFQDGSEGTSGQYLKSSGTDGTATWGTISAGDIPTLNQNTTGSAALNVLKTGDTMSGTLTVPVLNDSGLNPSQAVVTDGSKNFTSLSYVSTNTASTLVQRDGSGNFSAGTITAALTGAASANVLTAGDTMTGALQVPTVNLTTKLQVNSSDFLVVSGATTTENLWFGQGASSALTTGTGNLLISSGAANNTLTSALRDTLIGNAVLPAVTSGTDNVAIGTNIAPTATTLGQNTFVGNSIATTNGGGKGERNVGVGYAALGNIGGASSTTGAHNVAVGYNTCGGVSSGAGNTCVGYQADDNTSTGSNNTAIGISAGFSGNFSNATAIGNSASATASNMMAFGNTSVTQNTFSGNLTAATFQPTVQGSGVTPTCGVSQNGELALTHAYILCVCNTSSWVKTSDGSTACTF